MIRSALRRNTPLASNSSRIGWPICRKCSLAPPLAIFTGLTGRICDGCKSARAKARQKKDPNRSEKHLAFVRKLPCCANSLDCVDGLFGGIHAHHVRSAAHAGTGFKPSDFRTVPLCSRHHGELHLRGAKTFEAKYRLDLAETARMIAEASPYVGGDNG